MFQLITALTVIKTFLIPTSEDPERGSLTIEHVVWAASVIAIVGIVVAAITAYVNAQAGLIH